MSKAIAARRIPRRSIHDAFMFASGSSIHLLVEGMALGLERLLRTGRENAAEIDECDSGGEKEPKRHVICHVVLQTSPVAALPK